MTIGRAASPLDSRHAECLTSLHAKGVPLAPITSLGAIGTLVRDAARAIVDKCRLPSRIPAKAIGVASATLLPLVAEAGGIGAGKGGHGSMDTAQVVTALGVMLFAGVASIFPALTEAKFPERWPNGSDYNRASDIHSRGGLLGMCSFLLTLFFSVGGADVPILIGGGAIMAIIPTLCSLRARQLIRRAEAHEQRTAAPVTKSAV